ncbi:uncharacterized protein LOC121836121 [Ixodes scapularis]|uniref:uncharacterized protein LOC121836121 n=1 Tax=Ixodes scapularis TaxID=6945 RepID=UPI001C386707|nr:uncharacterized protein LOC121836121 [Ixodes scapularis]
MASYRRLLIQTEVTSSNLGNCSQDMVSILTGSIFMPEEDATSTLNDTRRAPVMQSKDHDYKHRIPRPESLSPFVTSMAPYIAGFVVCKVCSTTTWQQCIAALHSQELAPLARQKKRGELVSPSQDIIGLCEAVEKGLPQLKAEWETVKAVQHRTKQLILEVLSALLEKKWFLQLEPHLLRCDLLDNHIYSLCKKLAKEYLKVRIHHMTKEKNKEMIKDKARPLLSKVIIIRHQ